MMEPEPLVVEQSESAVTVAAELPVAPPDTPNPVQEDREMLNSDMIPEELLFALTEVNDLLEGVEPREGPLAPVKTLKTPKEIRVALKKGVPDNVWHHKARRLQFRHLTEFPKSDGRSMGTRDISFLYDVAGQVKPTPERPNRHDKSAVRLQASRDLMGKSTSSNLAIPDSIIPDEYHLVKTKAVLGLEYLDNNQTTNLADHERNLTVFPSLKPAKRFEVVQLIKTMDQMLEQAGVDDIENEAKGPTQIHNLLEIIKKEQQIYDVVFHEVIRQVSIECVERGQMLSKLRQRYSELLSRIPRQIKSLHAEVMAQRALDRRLTEELMRFKSSIGTLTNELIAVKEHDKRITKEAEMAQVDLAEALKESQKNANLVDEYHDLYELQRHRLEGQVSLLTEERDLWCNASYSLSLKIIAENSLSTAKRLHVTEKAWHKLAGHFTVMLSDHDTESLVQLQEHVENWRDMIFHFHQVLDAADKTTTNVLTTIRDAMQQWIVQFDDTLMSIDEETDAKTVKTPPRDLIERMQEDIAHWEEMINENAERFGGDVLLSNQEQLIKMGKEVDAWTDIGIAVYDRHRSDTGTSYPQRAVMMTNNGLLQDLTKQLEIRITGENGVARGMISIQNNLDTWNNKFVSSLRGGAMSDSDWLRFYDVMLEYIAQLNVTIRRVGTQQKEEDQRKSSSGFKKILIEEMISQVQEWLKNTVNGIDGENGKMIAQVSNIHIRMVHWMVQMLLFLAPNRKTKIPFEASLFAGCTLEELTDKCRDLTDHISRITAYVCQCVQAIVEMAMQKKKDAGDDDADHEYRDFLRIKMECKEWIRTCQLLLNTLHEEPVKLVDKAVEQRLQEKVVVKSVADKEEEKAEDGETTPSESQPATREAQERKEVDTEVKRTVHAGRETEKSVKDEAKASDEEPESEEIETTENMEKEAQKDEPVFSAKEITKNSEESQEVEQASSAKETTKKSVEEVQKDEPASSAKETTKNSEKAQKDEPASSVKETTKKSEKAQREEPAGSAKAVEPAEETAESRKEAVEKSEGDKKKKKEERRKEEKEKRERKKSTGPKQSLEVIGDDENVRSASLDGKGSSKTLSQESSGMLSPPSSTLTQTAYDAIAKMDELQAELLTTEERAQAAESKSVLLEEELNAAKEKIRGLEKELTNSSKESKPPTPTTPAPTIQLAKPADLPKQEPTSKPGTAEEKRSSSRGPVEKKKAKKKK